MINSMRKSFIIILLAASLLSSCIVVIVKDLVCGSTPKDLPLWQEELFFEGKSTGISKLINTDGYWLSERIVPVYFYDAFIFYEDGTAGYFLFRRNKGDKGVMDFPPGIPHMDLNGFFGERKQLSAGCYSCRNDTICVEAYNTFREMWHLEKLRFKVTSRDTIELVSRTIYNQRHIYEWEPDDYSYQYLNKLRYTFVPTSSLPDPDDVSIKKKKWIWRDEKDWKAYKKRMSNKHK